MKASSAGLDRILRKPELLEVVGVSIATVYRWIDAGSFPQPVRLGPNSVGWRSSEVKAWLESREVAEVRCAASDRPPRKDGR